MDTRRRIEGNENEEKEDDDDDDDEVLLPMLEVDEDDNSESLVDDANDGHRLVVSSSTRLSRHLLGATFFILDWNGDDSSDGSAADADCEQGLLLPLLPTFRANAKSLLSRSSNWF